MTLAWINLVASAGVLFVEASAVRSDELWPRRLAQHIDITREDSVERSST